MSIFKWSDDLITNNSQIDSDHKLIIEKAAELHQALTQSKGQEHVLKTLTFLNDYVKKHFAEEEKLQMKNEYPLISDHKKNHAYFINELDKLTMKIKSQPSSVANAIELNNLMSGWFFKHIKRMDVEVANHLRKK